MNEYREGEGARVGKRRSEEEREGVERAPGRKVMENEKKRAITGGNVLTQCARLMGPVSMHPRP
jgi:hypothetical protein